MSQKRKAAGLAAVEKKIGVHALPNHVRREHAKKANAAFLTRWQSEEFRQLHKDRGRLGKLVKRFHRAHEKLLKQKSPFGFY